MTFCRIKCNATWCSLPLTNSFPRSRQFVLSDCNSSFPRFTRYNTRERIERISIRDNWLSNSRERIAIRENRLSNSRERITKPWNELLIRENGLHNSIYNDLLMALFLKIFIFRTSVLRPARKKSDYNFLINKGKCKEFYQFNGNCVKKLQNEMKLELI